MEGFRRYAIFYAPPPGPLSAFGAQWLGWDPEAGTRMAHPRFRDLPRPVTEITQTPRRYGLHATLKPPFRLAAETGVADLHAAMQALTAQLAAVRLEGLRLDRIGRFAALVPTAPSQPLDDLAAALVRSLDGFRAPAPPEELERRRAAGLSARQEALLADWGYPYVLDEFRFHITLSGALEDAEADRLVTTLGPVLAPLIDGPHRIRDVCLFGEARDGRFHNLHRYALTG